MQVEQMAALATSWTGKQSQRILGILSVSSTQHPILPLWGSLVCVGGEGGSHPRMTLAQ